MKPRALHDLDKYHQGIPPAQGFLKMLQVHLFYSDTASTGSIKLIYDQVNFTKDFVDSKANLLYKTY